jgi:hypothetical protein
MRSLGVSIPKSPARAIDVSSRSLGDERITYKLVAFKKQAYMLPEGAYKLSVFSSFSSYVHIYNLVG